MLGFRERGVPGFRSPLVGQWVEEGRLGRTATWTDGDVLCKDCGSWSFRCASPVTPTSRSQCVLGISFRRWHPLDCDLYVPRPPRLDLQRHTGDTGARLDRSRGGSISPLPFVRRDHVRTRRR